MSVVHSILPTVPAELKYGNHDGERQPTQKHDEHPTDILHTEWVRLGVLALVLQILQNQCGQAGNLSGERRRGDCYSDEVSK